MSLYDSIEKSIREHAEMLCVSNSVQDSDVHRTVNWVVRDNPDIYWFDYQYLFDNCEKKITFNYQFTKEQKLRIQERIDEGVRYGFQIEYVKSLDVYEQVMCVYKWLLYNCHYSDKIDENQNIYNVFVRRVSDSLGYAKAAQYLFKMLGIGSRLVFGRFIKGNKKRVHCWNIVYIRGYPYHLDISLGDTALERILKNSGIKNIFRLGDLNYNYFCVSTWKIEKVLRTDDLESYPICNNNLEWKIVESLSHIYVGRPTCASKSSAFDNTTRIIGNILGVALYPITLIGKGVFWIKDMVADAFEDSDALSDVLDGLADTFDDSIILSSTLSIAATAIHNTECTMEPEKGFPNINEIQIRKTTKDDVYSSIFAPAEVKKKSHLLLQVFLHLYEEAEKVKVFAQESQKNAERRDYIPLQCKLKKGDKVDVLLNIYGEVLLMSDKKSVVWQGSFTKCSFDYFVHKDIDVEELSCLAMLTVNGVPVGEMRFITKIVESPRQLNTEMIAHKNNKVFISYSHQDESKVKFLHEGLELRAVPHFFDRKYLKAGDVFPQVIQDYINSADLFILCWSENASKSEYVQKERLQALERAFPHVQPEKAAKLRIYPMSIEPRAELPSDMKEYYHFGEI